MYWPVRVGLVPDSTQKVCDKTRFKFPSFRPWHLEQWRMAKNQNARSKQQHTFINIIVKSISIEGNSLVISSPNDIVILVV